MPKGHPTPNQFHPKCSICGKQVKQRRRGKVAFFSHLKAAKDGHKPQVDVVTDGYAVMDRGDWFDGGNLLGGTTMNDRPKASGICGSQYDSFEKKSEPDMVLRDMSPPISPMRDSGIKSNSSSIFSVIHAAIECIDELILSAFTGPDVLHAEKIIKDHLERCVALRLDHLKVDADHR